MVGYERCRLRCASDPECYCYSIVDEVCYTGNQCECEAGRNESYCVEVKGNGLVVYKDLVRVG